MASASPISRRAAHVWLPRLELATSARRAPLGIPLGPTYGAPRLSINDNSLPVLQIRSRELFNRKDLVMNYPVTRNNRAEIYTNGPESFSALLEAIDRAEKFVHLSFFIFKDDRRGHQLADALIKKARAGIEVRLVLDDYGQLLGGDGLGRAKLDEMKRAGIEIMTNSPLDPARLTGIANPADHRKMVIVDGVVAFTGGMNIGDAYIDEWHDYLFRVEGHVVEQIGNEFLLDWRALGGREFSPELEGAAFKEKYFPRAPKNTGDVKMKVVQTIPGESHEILKNYLTKIRFARSQIWIESPYITNSEIHDALLKARERGVEINLIIPAENNHPSCDYAAAVDFLALMNAGARIYQYPGMCHGKLMVVDREYVIFGSANLDDLSLTKVYEMNVELQDRATAKKVIKNLIERDVARSKRLRPEQITPEKLAKGDFWRLFEDHL